METFYINPAAENEIAKIISNFNDSASGWDNLSPATFKTIKQHIKQPITQSVIYHLQMGISQMKWNKPK